MASLFPAGGQEWISLYQTFGSRYRSLDAALRFFVEMVLYSPCDLCKELHAALDREYLLVCEQIANDPEAADRIPVPEEQISRLEQLAACFFNPSIQTPTNHAFLSFYAPSFFRDFLTFLPTPQAYVQRNGKGHLAMGVAKKSLGSLRDLGEHLLRWCRYLESILRSRYFYSLPDPRITQFWRIRDVLKIPVIWQSLAPSGNVTNDRLLSLCPCSPDLYMKNHSSKYVKLIDMNERVHMFSLALMEPVDTLYSLSAAHTQLLLRTVLGQQQEGRTPVDMSCSLPAIVPLHPCALLVESPTTSVSLRGIAESEYHRCGTELAVTLWKTTSQRKVVEAMQDTISEDFLKQFV